MLLQLGCELAQGYGIARAMPAKDFLNWSYEWQPDLAWLAQTKVDREDLFLVYAAVDHRAWVADIAHHFRDELELPPPLDIHECRFCKWLDKERFGSNHTDAAYRAIKLVHTKIHHLAGVLLELKTCGRGSEAIERLDELYALRDDLLRQLKSLRH